MPRRYIIALWVGFAVIMMVCALIVYFVFGPPY